MPWTVFPDNVRLPRRGVNSCRFVLRLRVCVIPWFCRATDLDLREYWRKRSHYFAYY